MSGDVRQDLVDANRVLAGEGVLDAYGHVSARSPGRADRFLISRSMAPALVTRDDVLELDLEGSPRSEPSARVFLERFIHGEIYRRRPDVRAVVHSHALAVLPFTVVRSVAMRPICHMCGFLADVPPTFDIADHAGDASDLLIRNQAFGAALAEHLGDGSVVLMRGHGFTATGDSVAQATYRAVYTTRNAQVQAAAMAMGEPRYLSPGEAMACEDTLTGSLGRAWDLWRRLHNGRSEPS